MNRKYIKSIKPILFSWSQQYSPKALTPSPGNAQKATSITENEMQAKSWIKNP